MKRKTTRLILILGITGSTLFSSCSFNIGRTFFDAAVDGAALSFKDAVNNALDAALGITGP